MSRKFGVIFPNVETVAKRFLKSLGFSSFKHGSAGESILMQVPNDDLRIKFKNKSDISFSFESMNLENCHHPFEYILLTTASSLEEQSLKIVIYISDKNEFRAFFPINENTFCSSGSAYGTCLCHDGSEPMKENGGSMKEEISSCFEFGCKLRIGIPKILDSSASIGPSTDHWSGSFERYYDKFGRRDVFSNVRKYIDTVRRIHSRERSGARKSGGIFSKVSANPSKKLRIVFDSLPHEIIEIIIKFCDVFASILVLRKVCKFWNTVISQERVQRDLFLRNWEIYFNTEHNRKKGRINLSKKCQIPLFHTFNMDGTFESPWMKMKMIDEVKHDYEQLNYYYTKLYYCMNKIFRHHRDSLEFLSLQFGGNRCELQPIIINKKIEHVLVQDVNCSKLRKDHPDMFEGYSCSTHLSNIHPIENTKCRYLTTNAFRDLSRPYKHHYRGQRPPYYARERSKLIQILRKCFRFPTEQDFFEGFVSTFENEFVKKYGRDPFSMRQLIRDNDGASISELFDDYLLHERNVGARKKFDRKSKECIELLRKDVFSELENETVVRFSHLITYKRELSLVFWMGEVKDSDLCVGYWFCVDDE